MICLVASFGYARATESEKIKFEKTLRFPGNSPDNVLEIYNSPEYRKLRESTVSRLSVEPCNRCTFM